ncbi:MAG: hypothetical protein JST00_26045 [Deltaproteobacteria bacterium]|nr:hypothetical protein [Deltaproteobacteria bacterium]
MKKLLGVGLVGAAVVGAVLIAKGAGAVGIAATPEGKACRKIADLCAVSEKSAEKLESCVDDFEKTKKLVGEAPVKRSMECIQEANSCMAVSGCMAGGVGVGALGEMMKGFGSALSR